MSQENLAKLLRTATEDASVMEKVINAGSFSELKTIAGEQGYDLGNLSEQDAKLFMRFVTNAVDQDELSEQELKAIAGGIVIIGDPDGFKAKFRSPRGVKWFTPE